MHYKAYFHLSNLGKGEASQPTIELFFFTHALCCCPIQWQPSHRCHCGDTSTTAEVLSLEWFSTGSKSNWSSEHDIRYDGCWFPVHSHSPVLIRLISQPTCGYPTLTISSSGNDVTVMLNVYSECKEVKSPHAALLCFAIVDPEFVENTSCLEVMVEVVFSSQLNKVNASNRSSNIQ